jgi:DNA-binding CsgD family transcriptional regulator
VALVGDPGVGKTRLAREVVANRAGEVTTLWARGYPLGTTAAFGLWGEALDGLFRGLTIAEVETLCQGHEAELASVVPSLAASSLAASTAAREEVTRDRLLQAVSTVLGRLAGETLVVAVLDDMHVADPSSWEALATLSIELRDRRVLVLLIARPGELARVGIATRVMAVLNQQGVLHRIRLAAFDSADLGLLTRATVGATEVPSALETWVMDRSQGNALFAVGLVQALIDGRHDLNTPQLQHVPAELSDRVVAQLDELDDPARATLDVLALLGRVDMTDLVRLGAEAFDRLAPILDRLETLRLITHEQRGHELVYEVAHPLIQEIVYESIGPARRRAIHRQVARGLRAMGKLGAAAPHFARSSGPADDEGIAALLDAVGEAEGRQAYAEAFAILEVLLNLVPPGDRRWLEVLDSMARSPEWVIDHRVDHNASTGVEVLRRIGQALAQTPESPGHAKVQYRLAHFLAWGLGELTEAKWVMEDARARFERAGDRRSAMLAGNELAYLAGMGGDVAAWEAMHREVADAALAAGDRLVRLHALSSLGIALEWQGQLVESEAAYRASAEIAREDGRAYRINWILVHLAVGLAIQGRGNEAEAALASARAVYHDPVETIYWYASWVWWLVGDRRKAVATTAEFAALRPVIPRRMVPAVVFGAAAAAEAGLPDEAASFLALADAALAHGQWYGFDAVATWARGVDARIREGPGAALPLLVASADALQSLGYYPKLAMVLADVAEAAARSGDRGRSRWAAELAEDAATHIDAGPYPSLARLTGAWAALADGRRSDVADLAHRAADGLSCWPAYHARALALAGEASAASDRQLAVGELDRAAGLMSSVGALARRTEVMARLAALGSGGRRAAARAQGPGALTAREREVALLAATGLTTPEIAARLFIGDRTVETHLGRAYAKLGVTSRRELVRRAEELALTSGSASKSVPDPDDT